MTMTRCLAAAVILAIGLPGVSWAAAESCTFLRLTIEKHQAEIHELEDEQSFQAGLSFQIDDEIAALQDNRRRNNCTGDRNMDREIIRHCFDLNDRIAAKYREQADANQKFQELAGKVLELEEEIDEVNVRYKRRCNCWNPPIRHAAMKGHNIAGFQAENLDRCKAACDNSPQCRSVDFNPTTRACYLNDRDMKRSGASPNDLLRRPGWPFDYHERC